ncbi:MAG TPA: YDG/SRA domain-containing protein [Rhodothermales bacterium]|nr:YDG/SRA domain-containing protein [Rhodothermales bacterium]
MAEREFGHIAGYPAGSEFESRAELSKAGVHRPTQAGIAGSEKEGADSVVLSGGYEDDEDLGDEVIYTGQGGRDLKTGSQIRHQELNRGNLALAKSRLHGLPVRVIRGANHQSRHAPESGYRYDGLYCVKDYWQERGRSGYYIWRFLMRKIVGAELTANIVSEKKEEYQSPRRIKATTLRIVRDTKQAKRIKKLYNYRCQICNIRLEGSAGAYAESAHIRPLGKPHFGSDSPDNILCLCPNHHVLFDYGGFTIADDLTLVGFEGHLNVHPRHKISLENIHYHQEHYFYNQEDST